VNGAYRTPWKNGRKFNSTKQWKKANISVNWFNALALINTAKTTLSFQTLIHSRKPAVRFVAGDVKKRAFLFAGRANFGRVNYDNSIAAITAFPCIFRNGLLIVCHINISFRKL
jgi:hypothetical protein